MKKGSIFSVLFLLASLFYGQGIVIEEIETPEKQTPTQASGSQHINESDSQNLNKSDSQDKEYPDSVTVYWSHFDLNFEQFKFSDLDQFQRYRSDLISRPSLRLGNLGLPMGYLDSLVLDYGTTSILGAYKSYVFDESNIRFYQAKKPFTSLHYINGAESEQYFRVLHTQNFSKEGNFSFLYNRITSEGFFAQQFTNHTNIVANYNYRSRNDAYQSKAYFSLNVLESQENGGIFIDDQDRPDDNTILLDINLGDAQNRSRGQYLGFYNQYRLLQLDTNDRYELTLFHDLSWNKTSRLYEDVVAENGNFYSDNFLDLSLSRDTSFIQELNQELGIKTLGNRLSVSMKSRNMDFFQNYVLNRSVSSNYASASFQDSLLNGLFQVKYVSGISGFHREERTLDFSYSKNVTDFRLLFTVKNERLKLHPLMTDHRTNHFYFDLDLNMTERLQFIALVNYSKTKTTLQINQQLIKGYYYFDSLGYAKQAKEELNVLKLNLKQNFEFLRNFHLDNQLVYQLISEETILPLPNLMSNHSLYYSNRFFEKALGIQMGIDYFYIAESKGYRYNPALAQFYLVGEQSTLKAIHQLDLFLNIGITEAAKLFVKMENALQDTFSEDSYRVHDQPIPGRVLKIGLFWRMIN